VYSQYYRPFLPASGTKWEVEIDLREHHNDLFLSTPCFFVNPHPNIHPDDFAMVYRDGTGVMMEWERPISEYILIGDLWTSYLLRDTVKETARVLFDGIGEGKKCLNIGFGIGMVHFPSSYGPSEWSLTSNDRSTHISSPTSQHTQIASAICETPGGMTNRMLRYSKVAGKTFFRSMSRPTKQTLLKALMRPPMQSVVDWANLTLFTSIHSRRGIEEASYFTSMFPGCLLVPIRGSPSFKDLDGVTLSFTR